MERESAKKIRVVGLGQCSLDLLGTVDHYPELDQKAELGSLLIQGGGPVATAMVTLSRLGVRTAFVGAVGNDEFGKMISRGLEEEGVDCTNVTVKGDGTSQVAFISVDGQGHRNIFWHRGNVEPRLPDDFATFFDSGTQVLHLDGLHQEVAIAAAEIARSRQVTTVLDAGTFRPGLERLLPFVDHLVVSERFSRQITGGLEPESALPRLTDFGAQAVTITCGKHGSYSMEPEGEVYFQPAYPVHAVDTTGCGDVFHGGYIYGLLQKWPLSSRVRFAAACAALKTRSLGGRTAIPTLAEVESLLATADKNF